jgi:hypothetical protein
MLFGPVASASAATGIGKWFKIDEMDYVNGKWANEVMMAQGMTYSFKLPKGLPSGEYLVGRSVSPTPRVHKPDIIPAPKRDGSFA